MDQGVALFPENELVTMEIEFCGSAAILDYFLGGEAPRKEISESFFFLFIFSFSFSRGGR